MENRAKKILLMGDASNCHITLSKGLRRLGQEVTVVSDGSRWMKTGRDIDISRRWNNPVGGLELWWRIKRMLRSYLSGYDIVAINNPVFVTLRPERNRYIFDWLKGENGSIFLTALGNDTPYVEECLDPHSPLRYNEFRVVDKPGPYMVHCPEVARRWLSGPLRSHCEYVYGAIDGAVSVLYEYDVALRRVLPPYRHAYGGIPIDMRGVEPVDISSATDGVNLFLGRHSYRKSLKGADLLEEAALRTVELNRGKCRFTLVEDLPYNEFVGKLRNAHIVMDQTYSFTPATSALLAMASGQVAITGGEPEYYDFIGEHTNHPIVNVTPVIDEIVATLDSLVKNPQKIIELGRRSRDFVKKHNSCEVVARRFLDFWNNRLEQKR